MTTITPDAPGQVIEGLNFHQFILEHNKSNLKQGTGSCSKRTLESKCSLESALFASFWFLFAIFPALKILVKKCDPKKAKHQCQTTVNNLRVRMLSSKAALTTCTVLEQTAEPGSRPVSFFYRINVEQNLSFFTIYLRKQIRSARHGRGS